MEIRRMEEREIRRPRRRRSRKRGLWILLFLVVCAGGIAVVFTAPFFRLSAVYVAGNARLTQEQILEAAAIPEGKNIFAVNLGGVKKRLTAIPYVSDAEIQREFPNKLRITVHENRAAAYVYLEDRLAVIDTDGKVLELVTDAEQIETLVAALPVSEDAAADAAAASPPPDASASPDSAADGETEEADEDGETEDTEEADDTEDTDESDTDAAADDDSEADMPDASPVPSPAEADEAPPAAYTLPVVFGVTAGVPSVGRTLTDPGDGKVAALSGALKNLEQAGLLEQTTKLDLTDTADVKLWVENRLELWVGSLSNFEYKTLFAAKVIRENISAYETAIMDFRGDKLYVRSPGSLTPRPSAEPKEEESDAAATASPAPEETPAAERERMTL